MNKLIFWFLVLFSGNVLAVDGMSVEAGNGDATDTTRVGAIWNFDRQWFTVGTWRGHSSFGNNQTVTDLGMTPVFRLEQKNPTSFAPYLEGAIGLHLVSPTFINAQRRFGSSFQFGDHVGAGVRFGEHQQFDLGYRFQHLSNGGIKKPNQGINLNEVHFIYHF
jgi:lipid A 3-O-deacylase